VPGFLHVNAKPLAPTKKKRGKSCGKGVCPGERLKSLGILLQAEP
jgi:hypothetical protein